VIVGLAPAFRSDILHPTHFILITLKKKLLDVYRFYPDPDSDPVLTRHRLQRQIQLGQEQLDIIDKLQPGAFSHLIYESGY
jgi:hypothetical protein